MGKDCKRQGYSEVITLNYTCKVRQVWSEASTSRQLIRDRRQAKHGEYNESEVVRWVVWDVNTEISRVVQVMEDAVRQETQDKYIL